MVVVLVVDVVVLGMVDIVVVFVVHLEVLRSILSLDLPPYMFTQTTTFEARSIPDYNYMFFEHVSMLNSQSVLRNDVTTYALARSV